MKLLTEATVNPLSVTATWLSSHSAWYGRGDSSDGGG